MTRQNQPSEGIAPPLRSGRTFNVNVLPEKRPELLVAKAHTLWYVRTMKPYDWADEKNEWLRQERGLTFEDIVFHLAHGGLLDTIQHPNQRQYPGQRIFIVNVEGYACLVPFVEDDKVIFLKTIIPSRKMTRQYLGGD
jgi:uncharacterized DUF497 family protein